MKTTISPKLRGALCTIIGGVFWGFSGTCGQYLFSNFEITSLQLTCIRLTIAGLIMLAMAFCRRRDQFFAVWTAPKDAALLVAFGIMGLMMCQYSYMTAISYSNAATTTVLQTLNLVFIMLITCVTVHRWPNRVETFSLLLALFGTFLLATGGDPRHMVLSRQGLLWGLITAAAVTLYTLLPRRLLEKWDRTVVTGWGMLVGGITLNLIARSWNSPVKLPVQGWLAIAAIILLGTVAAFSLFLQGIRDIGPVKSSMMASTEPVSATVFSALWLGTTFSLTDIIGFLCITATIFLLAKSE
ncbi:MAG: EamA family transporter [Oscillibacter sp.]|nr:EamA family transporter [Oscillibacter sp.]